MSYEPVFVDTKAETFHATLACAAARTARHWCAAASAHRSRLRPCTKCGTELGKELTKTLGSIPSGARRGMGLPRLMPLEGRAEDAGPEADRDAATFYGAPEDLEDPRFSTRSSLDWGTASYGQDADEFLGGPTDDDNDWRGGNQMYD